MIRRRDLKEKSRLIDFTGEGELATNCKALVRKLSVITGWPHRCYQVCSILIVLVSYFSFVYPAYSEDANPATALFKKWQDQASRGDINAAEQIAWCYSQGAIVKQDHAAALKWWKIAAQHGSLTAENNLGYIYYNGTGVPKDLAEAEKWWRLAASKGFAQAQAAIAELYFKGQDYAEAIKWYRMSADQMFVPAVRRLATIYLEDTGAAQNFEEAYFWRLVRFTIEGKTPPGKKISGENEQEKIARTWKIEKTKVADIEERVHKWLVSAVETLRTKAAKGDIEAAHQVGQIYFYGHVVKQDLAEAAKWWKIAADRGNSQARSNLGTAHFEGTGVPKDLRQALKWWILAANQGAVVPQVVLGQIFLKGTEVPQNYPEAAKWFRIAAEELNAIAQHNLAMMYLHGLGFPQSYEEAYFWSRLSETFSGKPQSSDKFRVHLRDKEILRIEKRVEQWNASRRPSGDMGMSGNEDVSAALKDAKTRGSRQQLQAPAQSSGPKSFKTTPEGLFGMLATPANAALGHTFVEPKIINGRVIYEPDDAKNVANYRKIAQGLPDKNARRALTILADVMEKKNLQTEFVEGGEIQPLGFDAETYVVKTASPGYVCRSRIQGLGSLPVFIIGNGVNLQCKSGQHFIFTGNKDDNIEVSDWGLNVLAPGGGRDTLKLGQGQSITILEKGWGHKAVQKKCEPSEQLLRKYKIVTNNINQFGGIGVSFGKSPQGYEVQSMIHTSPVREAGIQEGDVLTEVDGKDISNLESDEVVNLLRGDPGTTVRLSWRKPGEKRVRAATITRKVIRTHRAAWRSEEQGPEIHEIDYKLPDKYLSYIVFGPGIAPGDLTEQSAGRWVNSKTGDILEMPECFNLVFADETREQAKERVANREVELAQRKAQIRNQYPLLPHSENKAPSEKPCTTAATNALDAIRKFPIVVDGTFAANGDFKLGNIYKGFRSWPVKFSAGEFKGFDLRPDQTVLVLANFVLGKTSVSACGAVVYEDGNYQGFTFGSLLSEAAVYAAAASAKMDSFPTVKGHNTERLRNEALGFLKENGDHLYHLEFSIGLLRDAVDTAKINPNDRHYKNLRAECESQLEPDGKGVSEDLKATIHQGYKLLGTTGGGPGNGYVGPIKFGLSETGTAFLNTGEYEAALYTLCGLEGSASYFAAAVGAKRSDLVDRKRLGNLRSLEDMDLSGLILRKAVISGIWRNVKADGTDFTNASFGEAQLSNVDLSKATVDLATYNCKTQFPEGFDPVARHMVPQWKYQGCDDKPIPKVNLKNLNVASPHVAQKSSSSEEAVEYVESAPNVFTEIRRRVPVFQGSEEQEYNEIELRHMELDGVEAQNSVLGRVRCGGCKIRNADFNAARLSIWQGGSGAAQFTDTSFKNADLRGSDINTATFINVDFSGANLSGVDLHNTKLINVNFTGANVEGIEFQGAQYDELTKFPTGFNPEAAGMLKMVK